MNEEKRNADIADESDTRRVAATALAASSPDESTLIMRMMKMLMKYEHPVAQVFIIPLLSIIIMLFVFVTKGTTAILALQPLILQRWQADSQIVVADRAVQAEQIKATKDQAAATKEVIQAVSGMGDAVRGLSGEVASVRAEVNQIKTDRLADSKRLAGIAAEQARIKKSAEHGQ